MNDIIRVFQNLLTFEPVLTNKDIQNKDFTKLFLPEMKIKYIKNIKKYCPKENTKEIIKTLKNIKCWEDLKKMSKWNVEIFINGELETSTRLSIEEIEKLQDFLKNELKIKPID